MATKAVNVYQEIKVCLVSRKTTKVTSLLHVEKPRRTNIIILPFIVFKRHEFVALTTGGDPCAILAQVASKSQIWVLGHSSVKFVVLWKQRGLIELEVVSFKLKVCPSYLQRSSHHKCFKNGVSKPFHCGDIEGGSTSYRSPNTPDFAKILVNLCTPGVGLRFPEHLDFP